MSIKPITEWPPLTRIQARVQRDPNGCWTWITSSRNPREPRLRYKDRYYNPRRLLWKLTKGEAPGMLFARCDNILCVNPDHFYEKRATLECRNGHRQTPDNAYVGPRGNRVCRRCQDRNRRRQSQATLKLYEKRFIAKLAADPVRFEQYKQARRASQRILRIAKKLDSDVLHWSPAANRWMIRQDDRWVGGGDNEALVALNAHLRQHGYSSPEISATFMRRMKALAVRNWQRALNDEAEAA